jgi:hypothetical protein
MNVSISITGDGSALKGIVPVTVNVSPTKNLRRIDLFVDLAKIATSTPTPSFVYQWDTTSSSDGAHMLHADAVYPSRTSSASISVTVANGVVPPPPPPPNWPASYFTGPLGVRNIVPAASGGALLVEYGGGDLATTYQQGRTNLLQRAADCGRTTFDCVGIHNGGTPSATNQLASLGPGGDQWAHDNGMVPVISWTPARTSSTANLMVEINAGTHDAQITSAATYWKSLGFRIMWRPFWEFNGNWYVYSPIANPNINNPGCTAAQWVQAYQRCVDLVMAVMDASPAQPNNVGFGFSPSEHQDHTWRDNCYPGDAYVDWIMPDAYNHDGGPNGNTWSTSLHGDWAEFREIFDYTNLGQPSNISSYSRWSGTKPWLTGESATKYDTANRPAGHVVDVNRKANWYRNIDLVAKQNMPNMIGVSIFDQWISSEGNDWRVNSTQPAGTTAQGSTNAVTYQGFKDLAATPRWNVGVAGGAT